MTLPYLFMFLSGCCIAARAGFGVAAVFARCMRAAKIGAGGTASQRRTGADDLGPRFRTSHGREYERRTRGSLPDNQEGRYGGLEAASGRTARCPRPDAAPFNWET